MSAKTSGTTVPCIRAHKGGQPLAVVIGLAMLLAVGVLVGPVASHAQTPPPFGVLVNKVDHTTPRSVIAARMEKARQMNAAWVRVDFYWYSNEWTPGSINWTYFDNLVQEANSRGLGIIATLGYTPAWATTDGVAYYGVPNMTAWENFVSRTAARYRGTVDIWEIWNEPDKLYYWRGTPAKYAELLARASTKIKAADPGALVAMGGLAQGGSNLVPDFLQQVLTNATYPAGRYFDLHNIHTNFRTPSTIVTQIKNNRAILTQYGAQKPIIATEASYTSNPTYQTLPGYVGGGDATLAKYIVDAYQAMVTNGVMVAVWATLVDYVNDNSAYGQSGLMRTDLTPKQAYFAYDGMTGSIEIDNFEIDSVETTNVSSSATRNTATIRWTTGSAATSTVDFGLTTALGSTTTNSTLVTSHSIMLSGLQPARTYYVRVTSRAADGRTATSTVVPFQTY